MPSYEWKCMEPGPTPGEYCGTEHTRIVGTAEYNVPPDKCTACGNTDPTLWEKFIGGSPTMNKSVLWRMKPGGKGNP